jgi:UDP-GlcNAc3NAcA epimerase
MSSKIFKILSVIGARPQFVKASILSKSFAKFPNLVEIVVHTGQHYDANMSALFFQQLQITPPKYQLAHGNLAPEIMVSRILEDISKIIQTEKPDFVLVYGDTNSTAAAALAAAYTHTPLAHVEAGLRSYNAQMLEETNRILTDRLSQVLFCPTRQAMDNLKSEGFDSMSNKILLQTGDVMYDLSLLIRQSLVKNKQNSPKYHLCTIHRAENTDEAIRLEAIIKTLNQLDKQQQVLMIGHPRTLKCIQNIGTKPNFKILEPQGFIEMQQLLLNCDSVITDSGGLQKEAFFYEKPCIVLRPETEWTELMAEDCTMLAEPNAVEILEKIKKMQGRTAPFPKGIFGNGDAAMQIAEFFARVLPSI